MRAVRGTFRLSQSQQAESHFSAPKLRVVDPIIMPSLLLDRHIEKNGGTSARDVMYAAERAGQCIYIGYAHAWDKLIQLFQKLEREEESNPEQFSLPPLCVETHTSISHKQLRRIADLCTDIRWRCSLWLRFREPLAYYLSFFSWGVVPNLQLPADRVAAVFMRWMQAHTNLQSEILLNSGAATQAIAWNRTDAERGHRFGYGWKFEGRELRREVLFVVGLFQTLGTTERFDVSARRAFNALGLHLPAPASGQRNGSQGDDGGLAFHHTVNCRNRARFWWCVNTSLPMDVERARIHRTICPDISACRRLSQQTAPLDAEIYSRARDADRHWEAAGRQQREHDAAPNLAPTGVRCAWKELCRKNRCKRKRLFTLEDRFAAAPHFEDAASGQCFTAKAGRESAAAELLRRAWVEHPSGGRVVPGQLMGQLVRVPTQ